jgi:MoxR-like ATPase
VAARPDKLRLAPDEASSMKSPETLAAALRQVGYIADRALTVAAFLAVTAQRPLLLEGAAGVGKTEFAKALATVLDRDLIRLQCYEGIDASQALYDWNYTRQLLYARVIQNLDPDDNTKLQALYGSEFLTERPLLRAVRAGSSALLLIDEIDRSDHEFEAFLLEILAEYSVTIPEIGTITASAPPCVVCTSNRTRELHDALTRRCMYCWIEVPDISREIEILAVHVPEASPVLAREVAEAVSRLRTLDLVKPPGSAEAIDWCRALVLLGATSLGDAETTLETMGWVIKNHDDLRRIRSRPADVLGDAQCS